MLLSNTLYCNIHRIYSHITSNLNAEIVGSAYTRITIITVLHVSKIIILTLILRGWLICDSANMQVYMEYIYIYIYIYIYKLYIYLFNLE